MTDTATRPFEPWRFHALGESWLLECRAASEGSDGPILHLAPQATPDCAVLSEQQVDTVAATLRDPSLFVFHVSHCGSTLLARLLGADLRVRVCIEPDYLGRFLARTSAWPAERFSRAAGPVIRTCAAGLPDSRRLVIKFASHALHRVQEIRACFPHVPAILVYREPERVAAGSTSATWGFLSRRPAWLADLLGPGARVHEMRDEDLRITYLERLYALSVENCRGFDRLINYAGIPAVLDDIRYGLLRLPALDISRAVRDVMTRDSKMPDRPFDPARSRALASNAPSGTRALASHYEALESHRLSPQHVST